MQCVGDDVAKLQKFKSGTGGGVLLSAPPRTPIAIQAIQI